MIKRATSLILILMLSGSVMAGMPLHSGGSDSPMEMMDCCKAALAHDGSARTAGAKLCCAINCAMPAPTSTVVNQNPLQLVTLTAQATLPLPRLALSHNTRLIHSSVVPTTSKPAYIRNLALLI
jgi:hypothetical protein